jgi:DNA-binding NtrC family response regulator
LTAAGYRVLTAANGGEAVLVCERHQSAIHLLLTDVVMPQISGRELAKRLTAVRPGLRVAFMSGYSGTEIAHHGVLGPDTHLIEKPFAAADLARHVRTVLDGAVSAPQEPVGG